MTLTEYEASIGTIALSESPYLSDLATILPCTVMLAVMFSASRKKLTLSISGAPVVFVYVVASVRLAVKSFQVCDLLPIMHSFSTLPWAAVSA